MHRSRVGLDAQKPGLARELHKAKFRKYHEKKLAEISRRTPGTGTLDNRAPYTANLTHLKTRPKKKAIMAARDAEVERANRDLLRQMTRIFTKPSTLVPACDYVDGGGNGGERGVACASINVLCRKRELERIASENRHLVKHLGAVSSSYDAATWEKDRVANRKIMDRLRTVRYERRKTAPEEFSRRGVRHLRKQVEQTRGRALEAGFAHVPRLFASARISRRARPESNGGRPRQPGSTNYSREHGVLGGGPGRERGRKDREIKFGRSSSERAAGSVPAEEEEAGGDLDHIKYQTQQTDAGGGMVDSSGVVNPPPRSPLAEGISVSVRLESGRGERESSAVGCGREGGGRPGEEDEEEYSEFADDDSEHAAAGGTEGGERLLLHESQDGGQEEEEDGYEQYSEFEGEDEEEEGLVKSGHNNDHTQDMSSPRSSDQADALVETASTSVERDDAVATTSTKPLTLNEAHTKEDATHNAPVSASPGDGWVEVFDVVAVTQTAMASPPRHDDGQTSTTPNTLASSGGVETAATSRAAVVSEQASPKEYSGSTLINDRPLEEAPSSEPTKQCLLAAHEEEEDSIKPREQPAGADPDKSPTEPLGGISKETSLEIPNDTEEKIAVVDRVPAELDHPDNQLLVDLMPIAGETSGSGGGRLGGFSNDSDPVAASLLVGDGDVSFPLVEKREDTVYSDFEDAEEVEENGGDMAGAVVGERGDSIRKMEHDRRGYSDEPSLRSVDGVNGTEDERWGSLADRKEGSKEPALDGVSTKSGEASGSAAAAVKSSSDEQTAVSVALPRTTSEEEKSASTHADEKDAVVVTDDTIAGTNDFAIDGRFKHEIVAVSEEGSRESHNIVIEGVDKALATAGQRQHAETDKVSPAAGLGSAVGDSDFQVHLLETLKHGSSGEYTPPSENSVFETATVAVAVAIDTELPKEKEEVDNTSGVGMNGSIDDVVDSFRSEGVEGAEGARRLGSSTGSENFPKAATTVMGEDSTNNIGDPAGDDQQTSVSSVGHDLVEAEHAGAAAAEKTRASEGNIVAIADACEGTADATEGVKEGVVISGVSPTDSASTDTSVADEAFERKALAGVGVEVEVTNENGKLAPDHAETTETASEEVTDAPAHATLALDNAMASGLEGSQDGETVYSGAGANDYIGGDSFDANSSVEGKAVGTPRQVDTDPPRLTEAPAVVDVQDFREDQEQEGEEAAVAYGETVDASVAGDSLEPESVESTGTGSISNTAHRAADVEHNSALAKPSTTGDADIMSSATMKHSTGDGNSLTAEGTEIAADGNSLTAESTEIAVGDGALEGNAADIPVVAGNSGDHKDDTNGESIFPSNTAPGTTSIGQPQVIDETQGAPNEIPVLDTLKGRDATTPTLTSSTPAAESISGGGIHHSIDDSGSFEAQRIHGKPHECERNDVADSTTVDGDSSKGIVGVLSGAAATSPIGDMGLDAKPKETTECDPSKDYDLDISKDDSSTVNGGEQPEKAGIVSGETADGHLQLVGACFDTNTLNGEGSGSTELPPKGIPSAIANFATATDAAADCEINFTVVGEDNSANRSTATKLDGIEGVEASNVTSTVGCLEDNITGEATGVASPPIPGATVVPAPENIETVSAPAAEELGTTTSIALVLPQSGLANEDPERDERTGQPFEPEPATDLPAASSPEEGNALRIGIVPGDAAPEQPTDASFLSTAEPGPSSLSADPKVGDGGRGAGESGLFTGDDAVHNDVDVTPALEQAGTENANTNTAMFLLGGGATTDVATTPPGLEHDDGTNIAAKSSAPSVHKITDKAGDIGPAAAVAEPDTVVARNTASVDGESESYDDPSILVALSSIADAGTGAVDSARAGTSCQARLGDTAVGAGDMDDPDGLECSTRRGDERVETLAHLEQDRVALQAAEAAPESPRSSSMKDRGPDAATTVVDEVDDSNPTVTGSGLPLANSTEEAPRWQPSGDSLTSVVESAHRGEQPTDMSATPNATNGDASSEMPAGHALQAEEERNEEGRGGDGGGKAEAGEEAGSRIKQTVSTREADRGQKQTHEDDSDDCYELFDNASSSLESLVSSGSLVDDGQLKDGGKKIEGLGKPP